ncbi:2-amino-4-hydroxy-6-hydroxymethyldihydropteridine diphosphokinase [candidate division KSB1 bacterium]|nr:2-amino-4-hydroxy-6-hydroxymethyldihydropteridine diphosphokinase [candidate division KSB1 bacterium]
MNKAVIALGANIDPKANIEKARLIIAQQHVVQAESEIVETEPIGFKEQPNFLNCAMLIETFMEREALTEWLKSVERQLGRIPTANKYGPRPIDLDIIVWNGEIVDEDVYERDFLMNAVRELWVTFKKY